MPYLVDLPNEGHGILICRQWVLTVAHAVAWQPGIAKVSISGVDRPIDRIVIHPGYRQLPGDLIADAFDRKSMDRVTPFMEASDDIALIRLTRPVDDVRPARVMWRALHGGDQVTIYGKGASGTGDIGVSSNPPRRGALRRAENRIIRVDPRWVTYRFDEPARALDREGTAADGDSGGPLVAGKGSHTRVVGLSAWKLVEGDPRLYVANRYGQSFKAMRPAFYRDWIVETIGDASCRIG